MELRGAQVAVCEANTCLGRYFIRQLVARDAQAIAVISDPGRAARLEADGASVRIADFRDSESLAAAFSGVDAVVANHQQLTAHWLAYEQYIESYVERVIDILVAMNAAHVSRCLHLSSVRVYRGHYPPSEEDCPRYREGDYAHAFNASGICRALSEDTASRYAKKFGIGLTTLRPSEVFGAFDNTFVRWHEALIRRQRFTFYPSHARICPVYAGDVAEAGMLALENPESVGDVYNVSGDERTLWDFAETWARLDAKSAPVRIPLPIPFERIYSSARISSALGWRPRADADAIAEILAWESAD
jgi:nucleoside-diphosphate-sugar epimerase